MAKLTRRILERAVEEAVLHMPIQVTKTTAAGWSIVVKGMAIDVLIDELAAHGVEVDESMEEGEVVAAIEG